MAVPPAKFNQDATYSLAFNLLNDNVVVFHELMSIVVYERPEVAVQTALGLQNDHVLFFSVFPGRWSNLPFSS